MSTGRDDVWMSFDDAVKILTEKLNYPQEKALQFVRRFDKNNDGKLSMCEFNAFTKQVEKTKSEVEPTFNQYDTDRNGYVTIAEAKSILEKPPFAFSPEKIIFYLKKFDADGNNKLDIEEFACFYAEVRATNLTEVFSNLDKNKDGVLSLEEVAGVIREYLSCEEKSAKDWLQKFDKNGDGCLDKAEFMQLWSMIAS